MQKFIKLNNVTNLTEEQTNLHPSQVKLVGYLKKKRTKVGGWRKMWFVLQNQLLLSYPSKEDYDKKLVPFRDVLNLVPGTIVRPLGGYRFAIQTTSESVYIFRCDDNKTYMDWITALVDSMSIGCTPSKKKYISEGFPKKPLHSSHSCSSLIRAKKKKPSLHIPIARGTARILNRTGLSENDLRSFSLRDNDGPDHFCLHDNQQLLLNQSKTVSRINRMFCNSASDVELNTNLVKQKKVNANFEISEEDTRLVSDLTINATKPLESKGCQYLESNEEICNKSVISRKFQELLNYIKSEKFAMVEDKVKQSEIQNQSRFLDFEKFLKSDNKEMRFSQENANVKETDRNTMIEEQLQRLSLQGSSSVISNGNKNIFEEETNLLRLNSTIRSENKSPFARLRRRPEHLFSSSGESGLVDIRKNESTSSGFDSKRTIPDLNQNQKDEPIYAVVDLKNKYEHRAKIRQEMEQRQRLHGDYMNNLDEVSTDYEEVLDFPSDSCDEETENAIHSYDDDNIYEPINIPEFPSCDQQKQKNVIWKYISRISIDTFVEMARNRKKSPKQSEYTSTSSPFANIRQKIGHHRKSIRIRMIKLYARDQQRTVNASEKTDKNHHQDLETNSAKSNAGEHAN